jgi:hypothetical protein
MLHKDFVPLAQQRKSEALEIVAGKAAPYTSVMKMSHSTKDDNIPQET